MKIAIMGRGNVGETLGTAWTEAGHDVRFGRRAPENDDELAHAAAAEWGDVLVLATPAQAAVDLVAGLPDLGDRIVIDCTNPLQPDLSGLDHPEGVSGGQRLVDAASGGHFFKAFSTVGTGVMASPVLEGRKVMMLYCGGDEAPDGANQKAAGLIGDVGFEPVYVGLMERAEQLEHLALLWIRMSIDTDLGRSFGFGLLRG